MTEQAQPQYGIDPETMDVIPMAETLHADIEAEYAEYTHDVVEDLRAKSMEAPVARYVEMHLVEGQGVLMMPRSNPREFGATVGGNHSYADELRHFPDKSEQGFIDLSEELELGLSTIVGKGTMYAHNGSMTLKVEDIRKKVDGAKWLRDIQNQSELFGIDGGTIVDLKYEHQDRAVKLEDLTTTYLVRPHVKTNTKFHESVLQNKDVTTGIVRNISIEEPSVKLSHANEVNQFATVQVQAQEGHSVTHGPLYQEAGFSPDNPAGYIDLLVDGKPVQVGIRYSRDKTSRRINIFYAEDYGNSIQPLQDALVRGLRSHIFPYDPEAGETIVTVATGNKPSDEVGASKDTVAEVEQIAISEGQLLRSVSDIEEYVEAPARPAVKALWDKNIGTLSSSAHAGFEEAYIDIDYKSLSERNKQIAEDMGAELLYANTDTNQENPRAVKLAMPISPETPVEAIETGLQEMADAFVEQELLWAPKYTLDDMKSIYHIPTHEQVDPVEFVGEGYYYDTNTQTFYLSEDLFKKTQR